MKKQSNLVIGAVRIILGLAGIGALTVCLYNVLSGREIGGCLSAALVASVGFGITYIPDFLTHKDIMAVPAIVQTFFTIFLFCAIYLGEIWHFYDRFAWWDTMLHLASGTLFSMTGYMLFVSLNRDRDVRSQLNPASVVLFAFCFALASGALWELYEFAGDSLAGLNMQRWQNSMTPEQWAALQNVSNLSCPGLMDTMKDVINDTIGAAVSIPILLPMIQRDNRYVRAQITAQELVDTEWTPGLAMLSGKAA